MKGETTLKRQIRRSVFETNSSSQHSLCVMKRDDKYTPEEILENLYLFKDNETGEEDCVWSIYESELRFGRSPFRALGSFEDKWLYACASLVCEYNDDTYKELVALALKYIPGLKRIELPMSSGFVEDRKDKRFKKNDYAKKHGMTEKELIKYLSQKEKDWGMELRYWKSSNGYWHYDEPYTGEVEEDFLTGFLAQEGISLEEFLINKKYVVIQDGDEYCYWKDMKNNGLINMDAIDHEI